MKLLHIPNLLLLANWASTTPSNDVQALLVSSHEISSTSSLLKLHKSLVEHESITGNEHGVAKWLVSYLKSQNFTVETQNVGPFENGTKQRENILAYFGKQSKTRTLVSSHIDTVPPFWKYERIGDEVWGRGSVDAKGSVATQI